MLDELNRAKPAAAKGRYLRRITVASTMGPGIKIDPGRLRAGIDEAVACLRSASRLGEPVGSHRPLATTETFARRRPPVPLGAQWASGPA